MKLLLTIDLGSKIKFLNEMAKREFCFDNLFSDSSVSVDLLLSVSTSKLELDGEESIRGTASSALEDKRPKVKNKHLKNRCHTF
ncbi:hypothetical protein [Thalassotalea sp. SU-HH00458]|uniref:hypothetical protein n=1 Tax=Thalassotalea sp. SU-HH00458 TaxID=3127657 RepID=UPI00310B7F1D